MFKVIQWSAEGCFELSTWDKPDLAYDALRNHMEQVSDKNLHMVCLWVEDAQGNVVSEENA